MKLKADIDGESHELNLKVEGARVFAEVDGRSYQLEASFPMTGRLLLLLNSRVFDCRVGATGARGESAEVHVGSYAYNITLIDPKRLRVGQSAGVQADGTAARIVASMPGKVVRLLVEQGAEVEAGDPIVVVEAMKMQNEMKSPRAGIVTTLQATVGATVKAGEVLAIIE